MVRWVNGKTAGPENQLMLERVSCEFKSCSNRQFYGTVGEKLNHWFAKPELIIDGLRLQDSPVPPFWAVSDNSST